MNTATETPSRVYYSTDLGHHADEVLECLFDAVWHNNATPEEVATYSILLDPYTLALFGENAVPFKDSAHNEHSAVTWASQFGQLRVWPITRKEAKSLSLKPGAAFGAKIGPDRDGQQWVYGATTHQVTLLAAIQVLREHSWQLLNPSKADKCH